MDPVLWSCGNKSGRDDAWAAKNLPNYQIGTTIRKSTIKTT